MRPTSPPGSSARATHYVINGRKWFITNAADPRCRICIVMGVTDPAAEAHRRHSMVLVPMDTPGVTVVRNLPVMHHVAPGGALRDAL